MNHIEVVDHFGSFVVRFLPQDDDHWLVIASGCCLSPTGRLNGLMLLGWRGVLRELVALSVAPGLADSRGLRARTAAHSVYADTELTFPLSAGSLAKLLGAADDQVRDELGALFPGPASHA